MMETKTIITFLGTTGDVTSCDCCGKSNLKKTVVLLVDDDIQHYGETCASNALARMNAFGTTPAMFGWPATYPMARLRRLSQQANNERRLQKYKAAR